MKKTQKILLHGCKVPAFIILSVLVIEYLIGFSHHGWEMDSLLLLAGYIVLCAMITCNNHGKKVRIRYEQELSYIMKSVLTNAVFSIFAAAIYVDNSWKLGEFFRNIAILTVVHVVTILVLCLVWGKIVTKSYRTRRIYLYHDVRPDTSEIPDARIIQVDDRWISDGSCRMEMSQADEVYLADMDAQTRNDLLKICFECNKPVFFTSKLMDMEIRGASLAQDGEAPIFYKSAYGMSRKGAAIKRVLDILLSGIALIVLSPVFLAVSIAIKCEDGGDIFYHQIRCTKDMKQFKIIKFRSMVMGAEKLAGPMLAMENDSRMTRVGRFIRKSKLDELPQLINIFKGDMSFVGPRPERPEIIAKIIQDVPEYTYRTTVPAGLTGYAQVHSDYHTEFLDKLKWDLMYIENYSLMLDFKIILMTVPAVLGNNFFDIEHNHRL